MQRRLAVQVRREDGLEGVTLVAGADMSPLGEGRGRGAVVVLRYPELEVAEVRLSEGEVGFPYIPGLLAFRELPLLLTTCQRLSLEPQLFLVDGQGLAHPRRLGIASHLGLFLDTATIGCAKSILVGQHGTLGAEPGSYAPLMDKGEVVGAALRTQRGISPVYVSIGHNVSLESALRWTLSCCRSYRLPEPSRLAHLAATGKLAERAPSQDTQAKLL